MLRECGDRRGSSLSQPDGCQLPRQGASLTMRRTKKASLLEGGGTRSVTEGVKNNRPKGSCYLSNSSYVVSSSSLMALSCVA